jgi:hypothetical protein
MEVGSSPVIVGIRGKENCSFIAEGRRAECGYEKR